MPGRLFAQAVEIGYRADAPAVVQALDLEVVPGRVLGVVGPNGSGKLSLVRALSRTLRPRSGRVLFAGRDLYGEMSAGDSARGIAVVPQSGAVAFDFTVREVVGMGRYPHTAKPRTAGPRHDDAAIIQRVMDQTRIGYLADRPATALSGGEMQRVLLARALAQEPSVLLLDEPTAALDIRHQHDVLRLVRGLAHEQGVAVLCVLHDLNLASTYCDTLALLNEGRLVAHGAPENVLTADHVRRVYGARVWVRCHPVTGRPMLLTLPGAAQAEPGDDADSGAHVHVICGGGTGAGLLVAMGMEGLRVTVGALNAGDTDLEAADMLGMETVREDPFSPLSPEAIAKSEDLATGAGVVIFTDAPVGHANLAALRGCLAARLRGTPVVCLQPAGHDFAARDFTGGEASRLWEQLLEAGAIVASDQVSAIAAVWDIISKRAED